jgi:phosphoribosyl 1,2-cyclic phosphodiesterase
VRSGATGILIDAGISYRELARRLAETGMGLEGLDALVLSHEHVDHTRGAIAISRRLGLPVYAGRASSGRLGLLSVLGRDAVVDLHADRPFRIGRLEVVPFAVPHDADDTLGFKVCDGRARAGVATDLGSIDMDVLVGLSGCDVVVLESNHDEAMLLEGPYPPSLKRRVKSPRGHLSNADAAELIRCISHDGLKHLALAHLSRTNNVPALSLDAAREALGARVSQVELSLGWQDRIGKVISV